MVDTGCWENGKLDTLKRRVQGATDIYSYTYGIMDGEALAGGQFEPAMINLV